jgi:hypothetical protein
VFAALPLNQQNQVGGKYVSRKSNGSDPMSLRNSGSPDQSLSNGIYWPSLLFFLFPSVLSLRYAVPEKNTLKTSTQSSARYKKPQNRRTIPPLRQHLILPVKRENSHDEDTVSIKDWKAYERHRWLHNLHCKAKHAVNFNFVYRVPGNHF